VRLVSWNCAGFYQSKVKGKSEVKAEALARFRADIAIIQECERPPEIEGQGLVATERVVWDGDTKSRGIGVFAAGKYTLQLDERYDPTIRHCAPVRVTGPVCFNLMAIWTKPDREARISYVGQLQRALRHYHDFFNQGNTAVIGDFNANQRWDVGRTIEEQFTTITSRLSTYGLASVYHARLGEQSGLESRNTFYMHRNVNRGHHIDYCFGNRSGGFYEHGSRLTSPMGADGIG
jgi:endonuclease/exonuclease/phosphatase family metal-dependent hydrolase